MKKNSVFFIEQKTIVIFRQGLIWIVFLIPTFWTSLSFGLPPQKLNELEQAMKKGIAISIASGNYNDPRYDSGSYIEVGNADFDRNDRLIGMSGTSFSNKTPADFITAHMWNKVKDRENVLQFAASMTGILAGSKNLISKNAADVLEDPRYSKQPGQFFGVDSGEVGLLRDILNAAPHYKLAFYVTPKGKFGAKHIAYSKVEKSKGALDYDSYAKDQVIEVEGQNLAQVMQKLLPKLAKSLLPDPNQVKSILTQDQDDESVYTGEEDEKTVQDEGSSAPQQASPTKKKKRSTAAH